MRGEWVATELNMLDKTMMVWALWLLISSFFHNNPSDKLIFNLGFVYNTCCAYFLFRVFTRSKEDVIAIYCMIAFLLVPVAITMCIEAITQQNLFSIFGGVPELSTIREGKIRAQGPFAHAILAGTVGAANIPIMAGLWQHNRIMAILGITACISMVIACSSTGPVISSIVAVLSLGMWFYRKNMRILRWVAVIGYIMLDIVMKVPAYYIIGRIDFTGGSTGWHRARLIEVAFQRLSEWWLAGTDYTRHWMATGVSWSLDHTDITNHYIYLGVLGGLPLMILFIVMLVKGFGYIGSILRQAQPVSIKDEFLVWSLGASLFVHAASLISVSYFDQSFIFLYLNLAAVSSFWAWHNCENEKIM